MPSIPLLIDIIPKFLTLLQHSINLLCIINVPLLIRLYRIKSDNNSLPAIPTSPANTMPQSITLPCIKQDN